MPNEPTSHTETKKWTIKDLAQRKRFEFYPEFKIDKTMDGLDVEPRFIHIELDGQRYTFNWLDLYMFIYFCATDSMRQKLAIIAERKVEYIPYELTFVLSPDEKKSGTAKRRVELPVDAIQMYNIRQESLMMKGHHNIMKKLMSGEMK